MIWVIGYFAVALVVWVVTARVLLVYESGGNGYDEFGDRLFALTIGGCVGVLWPLAAVVYGVYRVAFPNKKTEGENDE